MSHTYFSFNKYFLLTWSWRLSPPFVEFPFSKYSKGTCSSFQSRTLFRIFRFYNGSNNSMCYSMCIPKCVFSRFEYVSMHSALPNDWYPKWNDEAMFRINYYPALLYMTELLFKYIIQITICIRYPALWCRVLKFSSRLKVYNIVEYFKDNQFINRFTGRIYYLIGARLRPIVWIEFLSLFPRMNISWSFKNK